MDPAGATPDEVESVFFEPDALVSVLTPFWSFYCIISLWRGDILAAFLFSAGIYGFALLAMLVPAVSDFDIALGRTSAIQG